MKLYRLALLLPILLLCAGCDNTDSEDDDAYTYTAFDQAGDVVVTGRIWLEYEDTDDAQYPARIVGEWDLTQKKEDERVGPQVGQGRLQGSISADGDVGINLNPDWDDHNVMLSGHFVEGRSGDIRGTWVYSTFVGAVGSGEFEAVR